MGFERRPLAPILISRLYCLNFHQAKAQVQGEEASVRTNLLGLSFSVDANLLACPGTVLEGSQLKGNKTLVGWLLEPA